MNTEFDLLIIGGGLVGGSLALALKDSGLKIALVEAVSEAERVASPANERALALSRGTVQILERLRVWSAVQPHAMPIRHIHVSDRGHFGKTRLHAHDRAVDALGYVALAKHVEGAIQAQLASASVTAFCPARVVGLKAGHDAVFATLKQGDESLNLKARLCVAADGGNSTVRTLLGIEQVVREYGQTAIVAEVQTEKDTAFTAYERFTRSGPLAMLPLGRHACSVVWSLHDADAQDMLQRGDGEWIEALQDAFGQWLGRLSLASRPQGFPLRLVQAARMTDERVVLIGNASHQIHPVAGQGFNLGLRDAEVLAEHLLAQHRLGDDIGAEDFLGHFAAARRRDLNRVVGFTDGLVRVFSSDFGPVMRVRNLALMALDRIPAAKRLLTHYAMGYRG